MIVVITGNGRPFTRLLEIAARYAQVHPDEVVWAQHGEATLPPGLQGQPFIQREKLLDLIQRADAAVTHAGCGSLGDTLGAGHVPLVMARLARYGEHVNDHQLELVEALSAQDRAIPVSGYEDFEAAIPRARARRGTGEAGSGRERLIAAVRREVDSALSSPEPFTRRLLWRTLAAVTPRLLIRPHHWSE